MITKNLFEEILVKPLSKGANTLYIVSGYATSAMAFHHLQIITKILKNIKVNLIVGMSAGEGLSLSNHRGFQELVQKDFPRNFHCSYLFEVPPVHSKTYAWFNGKNPVVGYIGSANYTQTAFGNAQREAMNELDSSEGLLYYNRLIKETIYCTHQDVEDTIQIYKDFYAPKKKKIKIKIERTEPSKFGLEGLEKVKISLLDNNGDLPQRSGLNWGQRLGREPNQAYIKLPSSVYNTDFFPERAIHFTLLTDDNKVLICSRAQDNGKAIHTPHNNSLIGEYFRNRLGIPNGGRVKTEDLLGMVELILISIR